MYRYFCLWAECFSYSVFLSTDGICLMHENHKKEQYFFDEKTVKRLADFASNFSNPCCLCAPTLGVELEKRGIKARTLDIDERFSHLKGFKKYDLYRPQALNEEFGIIICDPPFNIVKLSQLFDAIYMLSKPVQKMWISHLTERKFDVMGTFSIYGLYEVGFFPQYQIPQPETRIQFYGNENQHRPKA